MLSRSWRGYRLTYRIVLRPLSCLHVTECRACLPSPMQILEAHGSMRTKRAMTKEDLGRHRGAESRITALAGGKRHDANQAGRQEPGCQGHHLSPHCFQRGPTNSPTHSKSPHCFSGYSSYCALLFCTRLPRRILPPVSHTFNQHHALLARSSSNHTYCQHRPIDPYTHGYTLPAPLVITNLQATYQLDSLPTPLESLITRHIPQPHIPHPHTAPSCRHNAA
jgi:hypothetical protein